MSHKQQVQMGTRHERLPENHFYITRGVSVTWFTTILDEVPQFFILSSRWRVSIWQPMMSQVPRWIKLSSSHYSHKLFSAVWRQATTKKRETSADRRRRATHRAHGGEHDSPHKKSSHRGSVAVSSLSPEVPGNSRSPSRRKMTVTPK